MLNSKFYARCVAASSTVKKNVKTVLLADIKILENTRLRMYKTLKLKLNTTGLCKRGSCIAIFTIYFTTLYL